MGVKLTNYLLARDGRSMPDDPRVTYTDTTFDNVKVRVYKPVKQTKQKMAGLVYIHGGGWVIGNRGKWMVFLRDTF